MMSSQTIRSAEYSDQQTLYNLLEENMVHRHLEWRDPLNWIGYKPFLVLERNKEIIGVLACPPEPPGVAWLRLFAINGAGDEREIWEILWGAASRELSDLPGLITAALVMVKWMRPLLEGSGFNIQQELVLLEREIEEIGNNPFSHPPVLIRPMTTQDLEKVGEVDKSAFPPLWQNTISDLGRAYSRAYLASIVEVDGDIVGYHISTRTGKGIHLARLAVLPKWQRKGIGQALLEDLIIQMGRRGIRHISVNTQSDNTTSLALYKKTGFIETGERFPVYSRR